MIYFVFQLAFLLIPKGKNPFAPPPLVGLPRLSICEHCTITEAVVGQSGFRVCLMADLPFCVCSINVLLQILKCAYVTSKRLVQLQMVQLALALLSVEGATVVP